MSQRMKWHECDKCEKKLASYKSLWQHKKTCKFNDADTLKYPTSSLTKSTANVLDSSIQTCSPFRDIIKPVSNPKVSAIIDAIVNNGESSTPVTTLKPFTIPSAPKTTTPAKTLPLKKVNVAKTPSKKISPSKFDYSSKGRKITLLYRNRSGFLVKYLNN